MKIANNNKQEEYKELLKMAKTGIFGKMELLKKL